MTLYENSKGSDRVIIVNMKQAAMKKDSGSYFYTLISNGLITERELLLNVSLK